MQNQIKEFNEKLVNQKVDITIVDYVKQVNNLFYNIDIGFIDDFIEIVDKDICCITHELLMKYGVTSLTAGSYDVKKIIDRNDGRQGADYEVSQLAERMTYVLNPTFFKKLLIRSRNTDGSIIIIGRVQCKNSWWKNH